MCSKSSVGLSLTAGGNFSDWLLTFPAKAIICKSILLLWLEEVERKICQVHPLIGFTKQDFQKMRE